MTEPIWNELRISILKAMQADKASFAAIADEINKQTDTSLSRNACIGKARRLGLVTGWRPKLKGDNVTRRKLPKKPRVINELRAWHREQMSKPPVSKIVKPYNFLGIKFMDLQPEHCRYPSGNPTLFCGQPKMEGSSYCAHCHAICTNSPTPHNPSQPHNWRLMALRKILGPELPFDPKEVAA